MPRLLRPAVLVWALALAPAAAAQQTQAPAPPVKPIDPANVDTTCAACQDFFAYANGGWLKRTAIPGDQASWDGLQELYERNLVALRETLDAAVRARGGDATTRKLAAFYGSCMDTVAIERAGARPLQPWLAEIAAVRERAAILPALARLQRNGLGGSFGFGADLDDKNSTRVIATLSQGGLGLPDRDYYTRADSASAALRDQYVAHVAAMLRLSGENEAAADRDAAEVLALETALARASMTRTQRRNPDSTYHLMPAAEVARATPHMQWASFLTALGAPPAAELNVRQPVFFVAFDSLLAAAPVETWRAYMRWRAVRAMAPRLSTPFVQENFRFYSTTLSGVRAMPPRWKRCVQATDRAVGELLGQAYVRTHFSPEAKARALAMVKNIQAEFRLRLDSLQWMTPATKAKAYAKLDAIVNKIGYPDAWRDYSKLRLAGNLSYAENVVRADAFETARQLGKIGRPVDRGEWGMTPPTVNAYYRSQQNEIVFPAGIMQPPFFDPKADDAVNYGGMGAVIGHELTHGFDDQGRKYDAQGNLSGWWAESDSKAFDERAGVIADQFSGYVAVDSLHLNGRLTLGENLADLGGLTIAYGAYRRALGGREPAPIDGFTGDQRFFLAWAQMWRQLRRPEYARMLVTTDPHSPGRFRVNGPLSNLPAFAKAFGCRQGDAMVRPETQRAQIW
jgi:putative endopeptidase